MKRCCARWLPGATLNLAATCGGTCSATSYFPNGSAIVQGSDITTSIAYSDSTTTVNKTYSLYTLSWGPGTTTPFTWGSPYYRCDNLIGGTYGAGCIVPDITPILTTMAALPNIAANLQAIQQAGTHHYGRQADGLPLTRNQSLTDPNRNIACPGTQTPPTGMSCDEYPFASTDQGASKTTAPDTRFAGGHSARDRLPAPASDAGNGPGCPWLSTNSCRGRRGSATSVPCGSTAATASS